MLPNLTEHGSHLIDSYIPTVVELKVGTPELVGLLYAEVARKFGFTPQAVLQDDRFKIRMKINQHWMAFDFTRSWRKSSTMISPAPTGNFTILDHREWLKRILTRNMELLQKTKRWNDYAAMEELQTLLLG